MIDKELKIWEYPLKLENKRIYGLLYKSLNKSQKLIIFGHGFGGDHNDNDDYARFLAMNGYNVYLFDFCGGSLTSKSSGSMLKMSAISEKEDFLAIIDYFSEKEGIALDNIYLAGESQGGLAAALAATERKMFNGLILLYPGFVIIDDARKRFASFDEIDETAIFGLLVGKKYSADVYNLDIYSLISQYSGPVLIIHGDKDTLVPVTYSIKASQVYQNCDLHILNNVGHGFHGQDRLESMLMILRFLKKH